MSAEKECGALLIPVFLPSSHADAFSPVRLGIGGHKRLRWSGPWNIRPEEDHMRFFIRFEMAFERETTAQTLCRTIFNSIARRK